MSNCSLCLRNNGLHKHYCRQECGPIAQIQKETVEPAQINFTLVIVPRVDSCGSKSSCCTFDLSLPLSDWLSNPPHPRLGLAQTQKVTFCVRMRQRLSGVNTSASFEMMKVTTTAAEFIKLHILRVEVRV